MYERSHDFRVIVHASEQNALVAERNASKGKPLASILKFLCRFFGMINVNAHPNRPVLFEDFAQFRCNALWQKNGDA